MRWMGGGKSEQDVDVERRLDEEEEGGGENFKQYIHGNPETQPHRSPQSSQVPTARVQGRALGLERGFAPADRGGERPAESATHTVRPWHRRNQTTVHACVAR